VHHRSKQHTSTQDVKTAVYQKHKKRRKVMHQGQRKDNMPYCYRLAAQNHWYPRNTTGKMRKDTHRGQQHAPHAQLLQIS
jgi:hypothetical protein